MFNQAALDDVPKGVWIAAMVLGFIAFWPIGLAVLFYLIWSGKMHAWKQDRRAARGFGYGCGGYRWHSYQSTGNSAFDDYRDATLKRLEEEQKAFAEHLDKLRRAKDKEEFDRFMSELRAQDLKDVTPPPAA